VDKRCRHRTTILSRPAIGLASPFKSRTHSFRKQKAASKRRKEKSPNCFIRWATCIRNGPTDYKRSCDSNGTPEFAVDPPPTYKRRHIYSVVGSRTFLVRRKISKWIRGANKEGEFKWPTIDLPWRINGSIYKVYPVVWSINLHPLLCNNRSFKIDLHGWWLHSESSVRGYSFKEANDADVYE